MNIKTFNLNDFIDFMIYEARSDRNYTFISGSNYEDQDNLHTYGFVKFDDILGCGPIIIARRLTKGDYSFTFEIDDKSIPDSKQDIVEFMFDNVFSNRDYDKDNILVFFYEDDEKDN